jgi:hypothetical protein
MDEFEEVCLLGLILLSDEEDQNKSFRKLLSRSGRRMRSGKIQRASLQPVANSFALITLCGFDHTTFSSLLALFEPVFHQYSAFYTDESGRL